MPKTLPVISAALLVTLGACAAKEPRSFEYFEAHPDDARQVVADCRADKVRGEECANASLAVQYDEARERRKRFFGKK